MDVIGNKYRVGSQPVVQFNVRDVSSRNAGSEGISRKRTAVPACSSKARTTMQCFRLDPTGVILSWNSGAERLLGWKEREAIGMPSSVVFTPEDIATGQAGSRTQTARSRRQGGG